MRCLIIAARYLTRPCWAGVPTQSPVAGAPAVPRSVGVNRLLIVGPDDVLAGEVFTFRPELGRRGLAGGLPTG